MRCLPLSPEGVPEGATVEWEVELLSFDKPRVSHRLRFARPEALAAWLLSPVLSNTKPCPLTPCVFFFRS